MPGEARRSCVMQGVRKNTFMKSFEFIASLRTLIGLSMAIYPCELQINFMCRCMKGPAFSRTS